MSVRCLTEVLRCKTLRRYRCSPLGSEQMSESDWTSATILNKEERPVSANRRGENLDEQPAVANQSRPRVCLIHAQGRVMRRVGASCVWGGGGENHNNRGQISVKAAI